MKEYKIIIPEENYSIFEYNRDDLPAIMVLNTALLKFKPKEVFSWHLSLIINFKTLNNNGMPTESETELSTPFEENIDEQLKGIDKDKPNALFVARITWNGTRELIYRIYNPEITNTVLENIINNKIFPREFEYKIEFDKKWSLNKWQLKQIKRNNL
ncbi:hypothetical protein FACS189485_20830 [Spirochaetia bacterium]|nr:hypothetical protein FACS189485_20830 [Spirochaetia bacterium]